MENESGTMTTFSGGREFSRAGPENVVSWLAGTLALQKLPHTHWLAGTLALQKKRISGINGTTKSSQK